MEKRKKFLNFILTCLILALCVLVSIPSLYGASRGVLSPAAAETVTENYEKSNVLSDLESATVRGKQFQISDYPEQAGADPELLLFSEYCYSSSEALQKNYALYVYIYNPTGEEFNIGKVGNLYLNKIQLSFGSYGYNKYSLNYLSRSTSEDGCANRFYKFRIVLSESQRKQALTALFPTERIYSVSGFELCAKGTMTPVEYSVSKKFHYTGYAFGLNPNGSALESTLACSEDKLETLSLEVHPTSYRPSGYNDPGKYTQDTLHSVYFSIPNELLLKYGEMTAVHAQWLEATLTPALVTGTQDAYTAILPYLGQEFKDGYNPELPYYYYGNLVDHGTIPGMGLQKIWTFDCGFNTRYAYPYNTLVPSPEAAGNNIIKTLYFLFNSGSSLNSANGYTVSSQALKTRLESLTKIYGAPYAGGKYSRELFSEIADEMTEVNITSDTTFSLTSAHISKNYWEKLFGLSGTTTSTTFNGIQAIYPVKDSDLDGSSAEVSSRLYISESDYSAFRDFYSSHWETDTVFLFRYRVSDYFSQEATLQTASKDVLGNQYPHTVDTNAYFFQQEIDINFDIIDISFNNGRYTHVLPVLSSPIDNIPDATPPLDNKTDLPPIDWEKFLKVTLGLIGIVAIVIVVVKLIQTFAPKRSAFKKKKRKKSTEKQKSKKKPTKTRKTK